MVFRIIYIIGLKTIYTSGRVKKLVLDGYLSTYKDTETGVSQGSVLGPFLLLLYVNDITSNLVKYTWFFAVDTSLFVIVGDDFIIEFDRTLDDI